MARIAIAIWLVLASLLHAQTVPTRTDFAPMAPILVVKPNGVIRAFGRTATTDSARATALLAAQSAAAAGDTVRVIAGNVDLGSGQIGKAGVHFEIHPRVRVITTAATGIFDGNGRISYPYVYKTDSGLRRFFDSLGQVAKTPDGVGGGGIDIVCVGHSRMEHGFGSLGPGNSGGDSGATTFEQWQTDRWTHILKVYLQDYYNPAGVVGGYGYLPVLVGSQTLTPSREQFTKVGTVASATSNFPSHIDRRYTADAGSNGAYIQMDGTDAHAAFKRRKVSSFEISAQQHTSMGDCRWDVEVDGAPTIGAGSVATGSFSLNGATVHSKHWGELGSGSIDPDADNYFQAAAGASGNGWNLDGMFFYYGDRDCGIRLHDVSKWGVALAAALQDNYWLGVNRFFSNATPGTAGALNGKLLITDHIGADIVGGHTSAAFKAAMLARYGTAISQASKPCVLIVIPHYFDNDTVRAQYYEYVEAIYQVADELDHVAILNINQKWLHANMANGWDSVGAHGSDTRHDSLVGQRIYAEEVFRVLTRQ